MLRQVFDAAVAAVDPAALVRQYLAAHPFPAETVVVAGAGKAAARMAAGCESAFGPQRLSGVVVVPEGCGAELAAVRTHVAAHPVPDERSVQGARAVRQTLTEAGVPVICLISGGASSLLVQPRPPVTLEAKMAATRLLLASGATVAELNTVRKHLSLVKGGGLLRSTRARPLLTLALSDVVGDDPAVIGSGPTSPDPTTFADAAAVLERYGLMTRVPLPVREVVERGIRGLAEETVKPGAPETNGTSFVVIGSNRTAMQAAAAAARRLGFEPLIDPAPLHGDTTTVARQWLELVRVQIEGRPIIAIAGGETTVVVRGQGRGGRNQEFALALTHPLAGSSITVLSAGSDGIDGPTDAAGAFVDGCTLERAHAAGLDPSAALRANDSYGFFEPLDDLIRCGPTGTNVMDLKLAIGLAS